jgi:hypothetical protein
LLAGDASFTELRYSASHSSINAQSCSSVAAIEADPGWTASFADAEAVRSQ